MKLTGFGITLTNNEVEDIKKVIKCVENRKILLKGTTENIIHKKMIPW